jgi:hypothetical protein
MERTLGTHLIELLLHDDKSLLGTLKVTIAYRVEELSRRRLDDRLADAIPGPVTFVLFDSFLGRSRIRHVALSVR